MIVVVVVQSLSCVQLFATPMDYSTPGFPVLHHLPELAQTPDIPLKVKVKVTSLSCVGLFATPWTVAG